MKDKVHPKYYNVKATCACGATFDIGSTRETIRVDICSGCHPLFTGTQKLLDTEGRVEKFTKKYAGTALAPKKKKPTVIKEKKEIKAPVVKAEPKVKPEPKVKASK